MWQFAPGMIPNVSALAGSVPVEAFGLTYVTAAQDNTNLTTYTFTAVALGAIVAGSNVRHTIITVGGPNGGATTISTITVGGLSASLVKDNGSTVSAPAQIWICNTSTLGTTADIVVTWGAGVGGCGIGTYRMANGNATATATAATGASSGVSTLTLTIAAGNVAVAVAQQLFSVLSTCTWTGTSTPTEDYDAETDSGDCQSAAHSTATGTNLTFIATMTQTAPTSQHAVAASFAAA